MPSLFDGWVGLRHGGNLLAPELLEELPEPESGGPRLADDMRAALVALPKDDAPSTDAVNRMLDTVLEQACGLRVGWLKGPALSADHTETLLDGTTLKPRRLWNGALGEKLAVFVVPTARIGVGKGKRPVARVTEYLRRRQIPLGLVTNGREWRLVWADTDSLAWTEWDADRWVEGDLTTEPFAVLRRVLSWASLNAPRADEPGPLLAKIRETRRGQAKLSKELGERVRRAVELLLRARRPVLEVAWKDHVNTDLYNAACHFVMRLVVVLFAEARELLPVDSPVYHRAYGLGGLIDQLDPLTPERRKLRQAAWPRLLGLFRLLHQGSPHPALTVPRYGGDLFRPGDASGDGVQRALAVLEALDEPPDDDVVHQMLLLLTRTTQRIRQGSGWARVAMPVNFTELTSEYIGILYEGLLDYELQKAGTHPVVFLRLGDEPALPLDRLESLDDAALKALVERAKLAGPVDVDDEEAPESEDATDETDSLGEEDEPTESEGSDRSDNIDLFDDERGHARARAMAWAERAALVARLVRKPGKGAATDPTWQAELAATAERLIADTKLPGELYLVRWGGTRKGAGTFYTRPELTLPIVRRTLEPLLWAGGEIREPEEILSLNICDPAMGSGSFLVAALRILTATVMESLHHHNRIQSRGDQLHVRCSALPDADQDVTEDALEAIVRRAVVEHCIYGVDIDPLAVELARVALWVETLDKRLPFTFLDHKLRCGNALVGTWIDRFRDYPLLAWERKSPDEKWKGSHHKANRWHDALKARKKAVVSEQADLLGSEQLPFKGTTDEELKASLRNVQRFYDRMRKIPASQPDERARIWRESIVADRDLKRVRDAFDTWCALWFWPLDRIEEAPGPRTFLKVDDSVSATVKDRGIL